VADVEYSVLANLGVEGAGKFKGEMSSAAGGVKKFGGGVAGVASQVADLGFSAVSMAAKVATIVTGVTFAAASAGAVAIGKNLSMLEDKSIQLGAVMAAATGRPFEDVRKDTNKLFNDFRKDAITSAGETADFVGVAASISGAVMGAGRSMEDLRKITQGVVAAAPALGVSFQQAGTDVMRMFQGGAGAELPFFKAMQSIPSLGIASAEAFNKLDMQKRIDITTKALRDPAFLAAADAMGKTFTGLSSTVSDQAKNIGGALVGPAFEAVKTGMQKITDLMMPKLNAGAPFMKSITRIGEYMGATAMTIAGQWKQVFPNMSGGVDMLAAKLEVGVQRVMWKITDASQWVADHWGTIRDHAAAFATKLEHAANVAKGLVEKLGGGDLGTGLERLAMGAAGVKVAQTGAPIAAQGATALSGLGMLAKALGMGGAGGGTAATAAAGAGAGEAAAGGGGAAAAAAGVSGGAVAGIAAVVGVAFLAIKEAVERNSYGIVDAFKASVSDLWTSLEGLWGAVLRLYEASRPLLNVLGVLLISAAGAAVDVLDLLVKGVTFVVDAVGGLISSVTDLVTHSESLNSVFSTLSSWLVDIAVKLGALMGKGSVGDGEALEAMPVRVGKTEIIEHVAQDWWTKADNAVAGKKGKGPSAGGGGKQQIDVRLKVDLNGGDNAEAIIIRSKNAIAKAIQDAADQARISTSTIRGVTT